MRRRAKKEAREPPEQTEWVGLVRLDAIPAFAAWLSAPRQWWELDERRGVTVCQRTVMALWYAFLLDVELSNG